MVKELEKVSPELMPFSLIVQSTYLLVIYQKSFKQDLSGISIGMDNR